MAERIKRTEISEADIYGDMTASAERLEKQIKETNAGFKEQAIVLGKLNAEADKSQKGINTTVAVYQKLNKTVSDKASLDQTEIRNSKLLEKARLEEIRVQKAREVAMDKFERARQKEVQTAQKARKATIDSNNAYKQLTKQVNNASDRFKRLAAQYGVTDSRAVKARQTFERLDDSLRKITTAARDGRRDVGRYGLALDSVRGGAMKLAGVFGAGLGIFSILSSGKETIVQFNQSIADLSAITGATGKDLEFFKNRAIELGKTTQGGASAVVEAYKLIGSAKPELLSNAKALDAVTQSAITLSKASGLDLPDAATRLTDAMNQFGAPAEQAGKFIDVLANGAKFGAAEIPQVTDALLKFGAVAKSSNVNIEESTALVEALAEKGLKGAEAGTSLRNVMLKLSAPDALPKEARAELERLGINFDVLKDKSLPFSKRLEELKPLLNDNKALIKTFGTENAVVALNLIENTGRIDDLTKAMNTNGTATEQANIRSKTLGEAFANVGRAWDSFILSLVNGESSTSGLMSFLDYIAKNLPTIIGLVGKLVITFTAYKILTSDMAKNTIAWGKSLFQASDATKVATESTNKLGESVKAIGFAGLLFVIQEVITRFYDLASGAARARFQMEQFEKANKAGDESAQKILSSIKEEGAARDAVIRKKIQQINLIRQQAYEEAKELKASRDKLAANWQLTFTSQEYAAALGLINKKLIDKRSKVEALTTTIEGLKTGLQTAGGAVDFVGDETEDYTASAEKAAKATKDLDKEIGRLGKRKPEESPLAEFTQREVGPGFEEDLSEFTEIEELKRLELLKTSMTDEEIQKEMTKVQIENLEWRLQNLKDLGQDTLQVEIELAEKKRSLLEKEEKKTNETLELLGEEALDAFIARSQKKQELLDLEISKSQQLEDRLAEQAASGNITAEKSLAVQEKVSAEKIRQREQEAKKEQLLEEIKAVYLAVNNFLEQGDALPEAILKGTTGVFGIKKLLSSIAGFYKGTKGKLGDENTAMHGGKDGHLIWADSNEMILNPSQVSALEKAGIKTTDGVVNQAIMTKQLSGTMSISSTKVDPYVSTNSALISEIRDLRAEVRNKPETNIELGNITRATIDIIERTRRGSKTVTTTHRIGR